MATEGVAVGSGSVCDITACVQIAFLTCGFVVRFETLRLYTGSAIFSYTTATPCLPLRLGVVPTFAAWTVLQDVPWVASTRTWWFYWFAVITFPSGLLSIIRVLLALD
jgi:hypothetical protein